MLGTSRRILIIGLPIVLLFSTIAPIAAEEKYECNDSICFVHLFSSEYTVPTHLIIRPGATVVWFVHDTEIHHFISGTGPDDPGRGADFDSGSIRLPQVFNLTFVKAGVYPYYDSAYPNLKLRIEVTGEPVPIVSKTSKQTETSGMLSAESLVPGDIYPTKVEVRRYVNLYRLPKGLLAPLGIAVGSEETIWFAQSNASKIARLTLNNASVTEYVIPGAKPPLEIWNIVLDTAGRLWFADANGNAIWSFDPPTSSFTKYPLPTPNALPLWVILDADGKLWFTELQGNRIGRLDPSLTVANTAQGITEFEVPTKNSGPAQLTIGPDGRVWFTESFSKKIGTFDPKTLSFREYEVPATLLSPVGIAVDSKLKVWIADHGASKLVGFDPSTNAVEEYSTSIPRGSYPVSLPYWVFIDRRDGIWFNEHTGGKLARFVPSERVLVEYHTSGEDAWPLSFALDKLGNAWFTEFNGNNIGVVDISRPLSHSLTPQKRTLSVKTGDKTSIELTVQGLTQGPVTVTFGASTPLDILGRLRNASAVFTTDPLEVRDRSSARSVFELSIEQSHQIGQLPLMLTSTDGEVTYSASVLVTVEGPSDSGLTVLLLVAGIVLVIVGFVVLRRRKGR